MHLSKKYYIGAHYEHNNITGQFEILKNGKRLNIDLNEVNSIDCEVAYWRKSNAIHAWFVKNVQEGEDNCKQYYVCREQLKELLGICESIAANHELSEALLPVKSGFFFGPTEYDDWYFSGIDNTIDQISKLDLEGEDCSFDYYYESSW